MFTLNYKEGSASRRHVLPDGQSSVGRSATSSVVIDHDGISRRHAVFHVTEGRCRVVDAASRNGTYVNGEIVTEAELFDNDTVMLGPVAVRLRAEMGQTPSVGPDDLSIPSRPEYHAVVDGSSESIPVVPRVEARRLLTLLAEIGRTLVRTDSLPEVLRRVTELALAAVPAERCVLFLTEENTTRLVPCAVQRTAGAVSEGARVSRTILNRVVSDRVATLATDAQLDPEMSHVESVIAQGIRSVICVPLWRHETVIGALYADGNDSGRFSEADLELMGAFANYAAVAIERSRLSAQAAEEREHRERLQRYHSPGVVEQILRGGIEGDSTFIAQEREITVVFVDIVGFTSLAEGLSPNAVAQNLNRCLTCMSDAIFDEEGTLDKFVGDGVIGVFGAPLDQPDHAMRSIRSARNIRSAIQSLNMGSEGIPLQVRIGINSGIAMTGEIGAPQRRDYTVLGDVVNTAARLQGDIAEPGQIVLTDATLELAAETCQVRELGAVTLRGRTAPVSVYQLDD